MNTRSIHRALQAHNGSGGCVDTITNREPCMRVGTEFQAVIPSLKETGDSGVGSVKVWSPTKKLSDEDIDEYLIVAKEKFGYGMEQALGMLYWHGYCIDKALDNMPNFCPLKDEWSMEDKVIFQQAFQYHGKNFQRIRAMLPDKPVSSLVKYYYLWKRSYAQFSLMDKQARRNGMRIGVGLPVNNDDTDSNKSGSSHSDFHNYQITSTSLMYHPPPFSKGKQLPKGIHLNTVELVDISNDNDNAQIRRLDREILELKKKLQDNKQLLVVERERINGDESVESFRPGEYSRKSGSNAPTKWSDEEISVALDVIRKHGKDSEALTLALEGKTLSQCRNFFTNYKRKLNLPRLIAEYEIRNGHKLSRYGRQAKELVENGGDGLQEVLLHQQHFLEEPTDPKRPCYDPQGVQGGSVGYSNSTEQVAMTIM